MTLKTIRRLGAGGFGNVDEVEDSDGTRYARKTFSVNQPCPPEIIENVKRRFVREAQTQSAINHRNILPILYHKTADDPPWYLMPVALSTLEKDIQSDRLLGGEYMKALSDIAAGLQHLHEVSIFHRDLKPQNVLHLQDHAGEHFYAISDFGLASLRDSRLSKITYTGMKKGTDYYTPPELTMNFDRASVQSDIYSFGCILHDMVGITERVPCAEINEDTDFGPVLLRCTRRNPAERFQSLSQVMDVLVAITPGSGSIASVPVSDIAAVLDAQEPINLESACRLRDILSGTSTKDERSLLLRKLNIQKIQEIKELDVSVFRSISQVFCGWTAESAFDFAFCDPLADRLIAMSHDAPIDVQANCAVAMLYMAVNHNRFYVARRFGMLCGPNMSEPVARRVAIEMRARGRPVCETVEFWEYCISTKRTTLHPHIISALAELCK